MITDRTRSRSTYRGDCEEYDQGEVNGMEAERADGYGQASDCGNDSDNQ